MQALEHLRRLEAEIIGAVNARVELRAVLKEIPAESPAIEVIEAQITNISLRVVRAQMEMFAIEWNFFFDIKRALRDEKYPPIPKVRKSVLRYAEESPAGQIPTAI